MDTAQKSQNLSKKKIINSAIVLFANKGFDSTSTREICKHAGVNLSLLSYYFKTKEGLYTTIIESILNFGLKFLENGQNGGRGAPMSCAMVYWGRNYQAFFDIFIKFGAVVNIENLHGVTIGLENNGHRYHLQAPLPFI